MNESIPFDMENFWKSAANTVLKYSPQLFIRSGEKNLLPLGTGVLVQLDQYKFLLTARHCVENDFNSDLLILDQYGNQHFIRGEMKCSSAHDDPKLDPLDVAVILLSDESSVILETAYQFLPAQQFVRPISVPAGQTFLIVGFPLTKTKVLNSEREIRIEPFVYLCNSSQSHLYAKVGAEPTTNIVVDFHQDKSAFLGTSGRHNAPNPRGISGCGLWYIPMNQSQGTTQACHIAAMMIAHDHKHSVMIGTQLHIAASLMLEFSSMEI